MAMINSTGALAGHLARNKPPGAAASIRRRARPHYHEQGPRSGIPGPRSLAQNGQFRVRHGRLSMTGMACRTAVTRAGCQDKPTARAMRQRWRKYAAASAPQRPATPSLDSSKGGSRARSSRMPRLAADGPGLSRVLHIPTSPARMGETEMHLRDLWARYPAIRAAASTTSRLSHPCHPVSPVALPDRAEPCSYYSFYYSSRRAKDPSPRRRVLTCGN
jgi:hypothetical protein